MGEKRHDIGEIRVRTWVQGLSSKDFCARTFVQGLPRYLSWNENIWFLLNKNNNSLLNKKKTAQRSQNGAVLRVLAPRNIDISWSESYFYDL